MLLSVCEASALDPIRNDSRLVRVAVTDTPYLSKKQPDGSYQGVLIDYLQELSKYAGWKLEYVDGNVDPMLQMLAKGEVDLMGGMLKNEDSQKLYDFPTFSSASSYGVLLSKKSQTQYIPMDYSSIQGIRVGIYQKALNRIADFENFCNGNGLVFEKIYFEDNKLLREALNNGEVDAILSNDTNCKSDENILARFAVTPYYFAVTKGNSALLRELNSALSTLRQVSPQFEENMYEKHVLSQQQTAIFTAEERAFALEQEPLQVALVRSLGPAEAWNDETQTAFGIAPELLAMIADRTGLRFTYVPVDTLAEARKLVQTGEADLTLRPSGSTIPETGVISTKTYLDSQIIRVYHRSPRDRVKGTEALLTGYHDTSAITDTALVYDTLAECVDAVVSGNVESFTMSALLLENFPTLRANKQVFLSPVPNSMGSSAFLLTESAHPLLISMFDKAIHSFSSESIQSIVYKHTIMQSPLPSFTSLYEVYPAEFAWGVAGILFISVIVAVLLLLLNRTRLKLVRETVLQEESYRIVGSLAGEQIFLYDFPKRKLTLPKAFADAVGIPDVQQISHTAISSPIIQQLLDLFLKAPPAEKQQPPLEFSCKLADGTEGWFRAVGTVLPGEDGSPLRGIGGLRNIQKEVHHLQRLEKQANTDYLTGLYNRQYSEQLIQERFAECNCGVLLIMDIDYFKQINDQLGHIAGDLVLRDFAALLQQEFSPEDVVGRWGGDEFIAFVRGTADRDVITKRLSHLCQTMHREFSFEGQTMGLSISVGSAIAEGSLSYEQLFQEADAALYHVKSTTRNGFHLA